MPYILGLDTGGTYTDGVLIDICTENIVARAKSPTTRYDLKVGIEACIDSLEIRDFSAVRMVALSTTLATNAVVENCCGKTGLIFIGEKRCCRVPTKYIEKIGGETDIKGNIVSPISEEQAVEAVNKLKDKVDALAISAYASVRNPCHELQVKTIAEQCTELPVFCAHELTGSLGYEERTITAVLNAGLIGIVRDFVVATETSLRNRDINAEIMIVKSDGSLMRCEKALKRPIDTILSGPAASAIGARYMTGISDALVLDIGGTTLDIAEIINGRIKTGDECAKVADWKTKVHAIEVSTHGIGGDSIIGITGKNKKVSLGPSKAEPISRTAYYYKHIHMEIDRIKNNNSLSCYEKEKLSRCYCLIRGKHIYTGDVIHDRIIELLKLKPHSMDFLIKTVGNEVENVVDKMLADKEISIIDLTPTDILHILKIYSKWDEEAAVIRGKIIAEVNGMDLEELVLNVRQAIYKKIYTACIQAVADFEGHNVEMSNDRAVEYLIDKMFCQKEKDFLQVGCRLKKPLIAVGASAEAWVRPVAEKMNAEIIIPADADVANAIGSAFGEVNEHVEALIRKEPSRRIYHLYLPTEKQIFHSRKAALDEAQKVLFEMAKDKAKDSGCSNAHITVEHSDLYMKVLGEKRRKFIETKITAEAIGRPDYWCIETKG